MNTSPAPQVIIRAIAIWTLALALSCSSAAENKTNAPPSSSPVAADKNVRIVEKRTRDGAIKIYAAQTNCTEATITLTITGDNVSPSRSVPFTVDSEGTNTLELLTLRAANSQRTWKYHYEFHWRPGRRGNATTNSFVYHLPYFSTNRFRVTQADFGSFSHATGSENEHAIDFAMPIGTSICAARDGTVVAIRQDSDEGGDDPKYKHSGNYVVVHHADGTFAEYYHLRKKGVVVSLGQKVNIGQELGFSGDTGFRSVPHLHLAVFQNIDGQTRQTFPILFETQTGEVQFLMAGKIYGMPK